MRSSLYDRYAMLIRDCAGIEIEPAHTSSDARLIALALLAIAEQIQNAGTSRSGSLQVSSSKGTVVSADPFANYTEADFEQMARQAMEEFSYYTDDDRVDADQCNLDSADEIWKEPCDE